MRAFNLSSEKKKPETFKRFIFPHFESFYFCLNGFFIDGLIKHLIIQSTQLLQVWNWGHFSFYWDGKALFIFPL